MKWGLKARFGDIDKVLTMNPTSVEFHLTDNDVMQGKLNGHVYDCDYSVHLPEYWNQQLIDPCSQSHYQDNLHIYKLCIDKGLSIRNNFKVKDKMKVIMHPGGASIEKIEDREWISILYKRLSNFYEELKKEYQDIELLVENMPPLPWFYGGQYYSNIFCNPEEIAEYCLKQNQHICLDISHLGLQCNYSQSASVVEEICRLKPFTKQIHLAGYTGTDGEGTTIEDINKGTLEFIMDSIKNIDCAVIPETMWGHFENFKEFKRTIEVCNKYLGENHGTNL